jgi:hypothetical protein
MASMPWDSSGEALSALRTIVTDPQYGTGALSSTQTMTNLLKDLLPDSPREARVLIAASEAGLAANLQGYVSQGMDLGTASRLAAGALEERTALAPDACTWAVGALAAALQLKPGATTPVPGFAPDSSPRSSGDDQTMTASGIGATPNDIMAPRSTTRRAGTAGATRGAGGPVSLTVVAAAIAVLGATLAIWTGAFSFIHHYNSDGTYAFSESLYSMGGYGTVWNWLPLVLVSVLSIAAAVLLLVSAAPRLHLVASGTLMAFGVSVILFIASDQFELGPKSAGIGPGGGEKLGAFAGLVLLIAGVIGVAAGFRTGP